jgi:hypothetical protein
MARSRVIVNEDWTTTIIIIIRDTSYMSTIDMGMVMVIGMSTWEEFNVVISLRRSIGYTKVFEVD